MKQVGFLILTIFVSMSQIQAQSKKSKVDMAFDKTADGMTAHDFGSIVYGANGSVDFTYTNQGTTPLIIADVKSSCGCTIPTWTKEPVAPGQKGKITVVYNTTLPGPFNKTVQVFSNANNSPVRLEVRGKVNSQASDMRPANMTPKASGAGVPPANTDITELPGSDSLTKARALRQAAHEEYLKKEQAQKTGTAVKPASTSTTKEAGAAAKKK